MTLSSLSKDQLKEMLRKSAKITAFENLQEIKSTHTKVGNIRYDILEMQPYLIISDLSKEDIKK